MPNWKKVITSGSDAALNSLDVTSALTASGLNYPSSDGTDGQVLITDGSGVLTFSDNVKYVTVKNVSGATLTKGTPVHSTGTSGNTPEVIAASASLASAMPANFVLAQNISTGAEGRAVLSGFLNGVNTNGFDAGDVVYVAPTGSYTITKPEGDGNLIQNVAIVGSVGVNGSIYVYGSGRSNDIPNLPVGKIWVGSNDYSVTSSFVHLDEANHNIYLEGLPNTETPNIIGYNTTTGKLSYYSTSSFSGGGGSTAHTPDVYQIDTATITSTNTLLTFAGTGNPTIISGSSGTTRTAEATDSITFNSTGIFEISYSVQMQQGASSATDVRMNPQVYARFGESGGELTVAAGSSSVAYIRLLGSNQAPNGGCTCTFYIDVTNKFHILELLVAFTQPATNIDLDIVQFENVPNALSIKKLS